MRQINEIKNNIRSLFSRLETEFGYGYLQDRVGIKKKSIEQCLKAGDTDVGSLQLALKAFGASFELLSYKDINIDTVINRWKNRHEVPSDYLKTNFSQAKITKNIFSILNKSCGDNITKRISHFIQMDQETLNNLPSDAQLFTQINGDIYYYLKRYCSFTDHDLFSLGQKVTDIYKENDIFHSMQTNSVKECYTVFLEEVRRNIEKSFQYELISIDSTKAIIRKRFSDEVLEETKGNPYSNNETCTFSAGFISSIPKIIDRKPVEVIQTADIFQNKQYSQFEIYFDVAKPQFTLQ